MQRQLRACAAQLGRVAASVQRADAAEQVGSDLQRGRWRWVEPGQRAGVERGGPQLEQEAREVEPLDLRCMVLWARVEIVARVQPQGTARPEASGAACALHGGSAADPRHVQHGQARPG